MKRWEKPTNIVEGDPMIFGICPTLKVKDAGGPGRVRYNLMTGDWMAWGQSDHSMYACETIGGAAQMAKTINHYEATGEIKTFSGSRSSLEEVPDA